ncbi:MAG: hypothetical protein GY729_16380 [Desulfobacteraceae bacterium]|nr:hypothetical protein [Desulfobacteraceae bacterium]
MNIQYITNDTGDTTAVIVPIEEWDAILFKLYQVEPERNDTEYLLQSETMKKRLTEAKNRSGGRSWEEVKNALDL